MYTTYLFILSFFSFSKLLSMNYFSFTVLFIYSKACMSHFSQITIIHIICNKKFSSIDKKKQKKNRRRSLANIAHQYSSKQKTKAQDKNCFCDIQSTNMQIKPAACIMIMIK
ncbi:hypothetical protein AAHE18_20G239400 [Arachis hypogaea]